MSLKRLMRVSRGINYNLSVSSHSHNIFANNCLVGNANKAVDKVKASKFYQFNSICVRSTTPAIFKNSHLPIGIEISSITYNSNKWLLSSRQYHRSLLAGSVITRSCPLMEKISMKVPSMGDSITEVGLLFGAFVQSNL